MGQVKKAKEMPRLCRNCGNDINHRDYRAAYCSKSCSNKFNYKSKSASNDRRNYQNIENYNSSTK